MSTLPSAELVQDGDDCLVTLSAPFDTEEPVRPRRSIPCYLFGDDIFRFDPEQGQQILGELTEFHTAPSGPHALLGVVGSADIFRLADTRESPPPDLMSYLARNFEKVQACGRWWEETRKGIDRAMVHLFTSFPVIYWLSTQPDNPPLEWHAARFNRWLASYRPTSDVITLQFISTLRTQQAPFHTTNPVMKTRILSLDDLRREWTTTPETTIVRVTLSSSEPLDKEKFITGNGWKLQRGTPRKWYCSANLATQTKPDMEVVRIRHAPSSTIKADIRLR